ncbi:MAG: MgtC/SapB family protein [Candidatus Omnitrophota bacterium]|jgi:putative Mg2+ transporter-C (MgtC) family protein
MNLAYHELAFRLLAACVCGGLIGLEREIHRKDAGFRTNALVCLGSCLIMLVSLEVHQMFKNEGPADPGRIAAQVVSGIGFLGAGAIIRSQEGIRGLTTAAGVWVASGIGLACGLGLYAPAFFTTVITVVILFVFSKVDKVLRGEKE